MLKMPEEYEGVIDYQMPSGPIMRESAVLIVNDEVPPTVDFLLRAFKGRRVRITVEEIEDAVER